MITLTLKERADVADLQRRLQGLGLWCEVQRRPDGEPAALVVKSHSRRVPTEVLMDLPGIADVLSTASAHPLLDDRVGTTVELTRGERIVTIGPGAPPVLAAGPCAVEGEAEIHAAAEMVARAGAQLLRGGAFKPRTGPYDFTGHGRPALLWLRAAADAQGLLVVSEILSERDVEAGAEYVDLVQVGSRNMSNFALLRALGQAGCTLLIKRGVAATLREWRLAAEHALHAGARAVVFCERGIKGVDTETRNTLDLGAVALLAHDGHCVWVDPSHAAGRRDLVTPLSKAALA
ncbi:MAG: 3-deoxy-7-phosphoheptulonate synthase, partial [Myxococcota bacterium]|nr:3-deoxy-7-phosphoheptulonate synthase [Myxococcota bacterium]